MKIIFDNGCDIDIIPYDNEFSHMWYEEVQSVKYNIYERDRIYGFNRLYDDLDYNLLRIAKCINTINKYDNDIPTDLDLSNQESLNILHTYFEKAIGIDNIYDEKRSDYFHNAPSRVRQAIEDLNIIIHRIENIHKGNRKSIVCTFKPRPRYKLERKDWNFAQTPGTVSLNYCQVGKPPYDAYMDRDEHVSDENILPLKTWSADFQIIFNYGVEFQDNFNEIKEKAMNWARENNVSLDGWGLINVGEIDNYNLEDLNGIKYIDRIE